MNVLVSVRSIGTGPVVVEREGQPPVTLVPPRHVPVLVTCTERVSAGWLCRDLAAAQGVPIAAPVYELQAASDWRRVARPPRIEIPAPPGLLERVFGRPLEPVERRLIFELVSTAANAPGEVHSHVSPPQAVAPPAERPRSR
jgi:hypothetical protein